MEEDLFSKLFELFNQPGPVNWPLAAEAAKSITGEAEPIDPWIAEEYQELTRLAQLKIAEATPLPPAIGNATPVDRRTWTLENLQSFRYLVEPLAEKLEDADFGPEAGPLDAILRPMAPALLGLQMGMVVGFLSHRVLGQFDIGLPAATDSALYFIVPNIEAFAEEAGVEKRQVRLWIALHEVAHQAQFAVPWARPRFLELIDEFMAGVEFDPTSLSARLQSLQDPSAFEEFMNEPGGLTGMMTSDAQKPALEAIQAFMSVLEGYSDYIMDRAATNLLPDLDRMREAMEMRRSDPGEGEDLVGRLLGLDLKRQQYATGAKFCGEIEDRWGADALNKLWEEPEYLPTLSELADPVAWAARVLLEDITGL